MIGNGKRCVASMLLATSLTVGAEEPNWFSMGSPATQDQQEAACRMWLKLESGHPIDEQVIMKCVKSLQAQQQEAQMIEQMEGAFGSTN